MPDTALFAFCIFFSLTFIVIVGIWWVKTERKHISQMETVEGEVIKIKHTPTRVTRYTTLWLKTKDGSVQELDLNSSDFPDILHLGVGDIARVTYYPVLMGLKLTGFSFQKKEGVAS